MFGYEERKQKFKFYEKIANTPKNERLKMMAVAKEIIDNIYNQGGTLTKEEVHKLCVEILEQMPNAKKNTDKHK